MHAGGRRPGCAGEAPIRLKPDDVAWSADERAAEGDVGVTAAEVGARVAHTERRADADSLRVWLDPRGSDLDHRTTPVCVPMSEPRGGQER